MLKFRHKGYEGRAEYDSKSSVYYGTVSNIESVVTFQGVDFQEIATAFEDSVECYLDFCIELGIEPDKPIDTNKKQIEKLNAKENLLLENSLTQDNSVETV